MILEAKSKMEILTSGGGLLAESHMVDSIRRQKGRWRGKISRGP